MTYQEMRTALDRLADAQADGRDIGDRLDVIDAEMVAAWGDLTTRESRDLFASIEHLRGEE